MEEALAITTAYQVRAIVPFVDVGSSNAWYFLDTHIPTAVVAGTYDVSANFVRWLKNYIQRYIRTAAYGISVG